MSGTKVTKDPEAFKHPVVEGKGVITSDSLAADSLRDGGDFAEGNAGISGQKSEGSTASNTDTSGASTLGAAPDAEARMATEEWSETAQLNAGSKMGKTSGGEPTYRTPADDSGFEEDSSSAGVAPYAATPHGNLSSSKPKGKNLEEGGFDENAPNASFKYDIGSKNDPGLAAEQKFARQNAENAGDVGLATDSDISGNGQYETLNRNEEA